MARIPTNPAILPVLALPISYVPAAHVSPLTSSLIVDVAWAAFHWAALARNPTQPWGYLAVGSLLAHSSEGRGWLPLPGQVVE